MKIHLLHVSQEPPDENQIALPGIPPPSEISVERILAVFSDPDVAAVCAQALAERVKNGKIVLKASDKGTVKEILVIEKQSPKKPTQEKKKAYIPPQIEYSEEDLEV